MVRVLASEIQIQLQLHLFLLTGCLHGLYFTVIAQVCPNFLCRQDLNGNFGITVTGNHFRYLFVDFMGSSPHFLAQCDMY